MLLLLLQQCRVGLVSQLLIRRQIVLKGVSCVVEIDPLRVLVRVANRCGAIYARVLDELVANAFAE
ncbi:hypothetical protein BCR44DRAFT_1424553 [Catenaria anguillulae PL171]|uniref:Uncharacterized protein n=1 Tax=Catenaria anguillulae PL171 TaxID=765915 RepID=A0A1Y2HZZ5_9FUNG|nr:hypothetical protein BCR44DRAFT_1424553 [Catenaria anguillulae PL171]